MEGPIEGPYWRVLLKELLKGPIEGQKWPLGSIGPLLEGPMGPWALLDPYWHPLDSASTPIEAKRGPIIGHPIGPFNWVLQ